MSIQLNKGKSIGKVLYVVEGGKTEPYLLHRIFCDILDYQLETILRDKGYRKYNSKKNATSQVFVINAEESNIKYIDQNNEFLNNLFMELIENYDFDIDNAAIYYIFDRDRKSNTDDGFVKKLMNFLVNARDNEFTRQGILLLNYPSVEAFTLSNFITSSYRLEFETGNELKQYLQSCKINQSNIDETSVIHAVQEMLAALGEMNLDELDVDDFGKSNLQIYEHEEQKYKNSGLYCALSLLCISLIDLGLIEIEGM